MDKFKIGDKMYWEQPGDLPEQFAIGIVVEYNPNGYGWLKWVKYKVDFGKGYIWYMGNNCSPDVFCSKVYTTNEYKLLLDKMEYEKILDHGNGD